MEVIGMKNIGNCEVKGCTKKTSMKGYTIEDFKKEYISSDYEGLLSKVVGKKRILLEGHTGIGKSHLAECLAKLIVGNNDSEEDFILRLRYGSNTTDYLINKCKEDKPKVVIIDGINYYYIDFADFNDVPDDVNIICTTLGNSKPLEATNLESFYRYNPENILGTEELKNYIKENFQNDEIVKHVLSFLEIIKDTDISMRWLDDLKNICEDDVWQFGVIISQVKLKCEYRGMNEICYRLEDLIIKLEEQYGIKICW